MSKLRRGKIQSDDAAWGANQMGSKNGRYDRERYFPHSLALGGAAVEPEIDLLNDGTSATGWTLYTSAGVVDGSGSIAANSTNPRSATGDTTIITYGSDGSYAELLMSGDTVNQLKWRNFIGFKARLDDVTRASSLTLALVDANGSIIGTSKLSPRAALDTANVWQNLEFDIRGLRGKLRSQKCAALRIYHALGGTGADQLRVFEFQAYRYSNGNGPVIGTVVKRYTQDTDIVRGDWVCETPGRDHVCVRGQSNSTSILGISIEGDSHESADKTVFASATEAGDPLWVQVTGNVYRKASTAVDINDSISLSGAQEVDSVLLAGGGSGVALEAGALGQHFLMALGGGGTNTSYDDVMTLDTAQTATGEKIFTGAVFQRFGLPITSYSAPATGGDTVTLTAAQLLGGIFLQTPTGNTTTTLPTGTALSAACPASLAVGDTFDFTITVAAAFVVSLQANTGITLPAHSNDILATDAAGTWRFRNTAANTWIGYRLS